MPIEPFIKNYQIFFFQKLESSRGVSRILSREGGFSSKFSKKDFFDNGIKFIF